MAKQFASQSRPAAVNTWYLKCEQCLALTAHEETRQDKKKGFTCQECGAFRPSKYSRARAQYQREYYARSDVKAKQREYQREYRARSDVKAKRREYQREYQREQRIKRLEKKLATLRMEGSQ